LKNADNAGTILQRIESAVGEFSYSDDMGIEETKDGILDMFLHKAAKPVTIDRIIERRQDINSLYKQLLSSDVIILTLGLVECWYDNYFKCYLNKAPNRGLVSQFPDRFEFHRLDVDNVFKRMSRAIDMLNANKIVNILITVSPVPVEATFTTQNAVMANSYAKSVLRIVSENLQSKYSNVDYFPSYEIVTSAGAAAFEDDNVHVKNQVVSKVTKYMVANYVDAV